MNGRIMIVHSAVVMRMIVRDELRASGYDVVGEAVNGRQALERYRELLPDVVTMDMVLPEMDGVATVTAIVAEFPKALILMCTSVGQPALVVAAMQAGAKSFITKPFRPNKMIEAIQTLMA